MGEKARGKELISNIKTIFSVLGALEGSEKCGKRREARNIFTLINGEATKNGESGQMCGKIQSGNKRMINFVTNGGSFCALFAGRSANLRFSEHFYTSDR
jgi:hypothetical protein